MTDSNFQQAETTSADATDAKGATAAERFLIVNADDFGQSPGINRGIIQAHEHGIVTSASLMVRWSAAAEAAAYARSRPGLSVGLHFDIGEYTYRQGEWIPLYEVASPHDADAVRQEWGRQLAAFEKLLGRPPTHIDSHQHVHREEPIRSLLTEAAERLGVPLRSFNPTVNYCGQFFGQGKRNTPYPEGISLAALMRTVAEIPAGVTELGCHPGDGNDVESMYRSERAEEVKVLCDPQIRCFLQQQNISLCSFRFVNDGGRSNTA
jgi:predicted glycoside hydrolase/deacetylase ChbG (UPF0249 family)